MFLKRKRSFLFQGISQELPPFRKPLNTNYFKFWSFQWNPARPKKLRAGSSLVFFCGFQTQLLQERLTWFSFWFPVYAFESTARRTRHGVVRIFNFFLGIFTDSKYQKQLIFFFTFFELQTCILRFPQFPFCPSNSQSTTF